MSDNVHYFNTKPDTNLICSKFKGYKLSMQSIPCISSDIHKGIDYVIYEDNNYAYLYVRLFAYHNNLYGDPWNNERCVYYVNKQWDIIKTELNESISKVDNVYNVWTIPDINHRSANRYNTSLSFATAELAVLCNGQNTIYILNTGSRNSSSSEKWKLVNEFRFGEKGRRYKLFDSLIQDNMLQIVLLSIEEIYSVKDDDKTSKYRTAVFLLSFLSPGKQWTLNSSQKITTNAGVDSLCLTTDNCSLFIASDEPLTIHKRIEKQFTNCAAAASGAEVLEIAEPNDDSNHTVQHTHHQPVEKKQSYRWWQTENVIKAWFNLPRNVNKEDIDVQVYQCLIRIEINKIEVFNGSLQHGVDEEAVSWQIDKFRLLELILKKSEPGNKWTNFIDADETGEEISNESELNEHIEEMSGRIRFCEEEDISGMRSFTVDEPMEECDYATSKDLKIYAIDTSRGTIENEIYIGRRKLLCNRICQRPNFSWFICTDYDVDGFVWSISRTSGGECCGKHVAVFNAFAYILASKQSKFVTFNSDTTYAVVTEAKKRAYIYTHAKSNVAAIDGRQYIIDLGTDDETILGINATDNVLYLLTNSALHCYSVKDIILSET